MVFFFLGKDFSINDTLSILKGVLLENMHLKIVTVFPYEANSQKISEFFTSTWNKKILNIVIVTFVQNRLETIGYNPFLNQYFQILSTENIFYNKLSNLHEYTINVMLTRVEDLTKVRVYQQDNQTKYMGKDGMTIQTIIKHCNGILNVIDLTKIYGLENPWRPMNKNLKENMKMPIIEKFKADLIFDSQDMVLNNFTDVLYPHAKDDFKIMVPRAQYISQNENILAIFQGGFVYFVIFFVIVCPLFWYFAIVVENYIYRLRNATYLNLFFKTFFDNFRLFLGLSTSTFGNNFVDNFFLIFLLFCNLIVNNYFQSILKSILTVSKKEPEIDTVEDLAKSGIVVYSLETIIQEAVANLKLSKQTDLPKFGILTPAFLAVKYRDISKNTSLLVNADRLEAVIEVNPFFHMVKETLIPSYICFHVVKGSPYYIMLEKYVPRVLEGGLYDFWKKQNSFAVFLEQGIIDRTEISGFVVLTVEHFWNIFCFLGVSLGIACVVFILEIIVARLTKKKIQINEHNSM